MDMDSNNIYQLVDENQTIKIVPSLEDSLKEIGLNVDLDENSSIWFQQLKETWRTWKKSTTLENQIYFVFDSVADPFRVALVYVIKSESLKDCKIKSFPYFVIETLLKWSESKGKVPEDFLKLPAFHIGIHQRNPIFLNLLAKAYQINTIHGRILPLVKNMIKTDNCKLASQVIVALELFDEIPVEELLFPLILQDKINLIDEYLSKCPNQVNLLLNFLDSLLDKNFNLKKYAHNFIQENKIFHVKYDKIHYKPLGKLVARLCNKFNIPIEYCKNLSKNRTLGGLKYLIHQKYDGQNVSSSVWDDLVKDSLKENSASAKEFINMLLEYDKNEAYKWAVYLNIPNDELPLVLKELSSADSKEEESWDDDNSETYYKLTVSDDNIIIIDTPEKFYDLTMNELKGHSVISIDCEWKPCFGAKQSQVALIQIATNDRVYLIDTLVLNNPSYSSFWVSFQKCILDNGELIKLGFGLQQDLKEIKASVAGLSNISVNGEGLLDIFLLWKTLLDRHLSLPSSDENSGNSLSCLVQSCFGLPLQKSEQCSNWELRPLRQSQIHYAALDAHILLEIYYYLEKKCFEQEIKFEEICNDVMTGPKKKSNKKVRGHERIQSFVINAPHKSPNEIRLVVEPVLSHILSFLRFCGIDSVLMPEAILWCDIVNIAISEERIILVHKHKGTPNPNFPQSSILDIGKGSAKDQLKIIFNSLSLIISKSDLLRICMMCNEKDLKVLTPNEVSNLCTEYQNTTANILNRSYDDVDNYDNFLSDPDDDEDLYQPLNVVQTYNKCYTSKGVEIYIKNVYELSNSNESAVLCESCGALFWSKDELTKTVSNTIEKLTNLSPWTSQRDE